MITISDIKKHCKILGVPCKWHPETKEFEISGYFTDDRQDAIDTARHIAKHKAGQSFPSLQQSKPAHIG